MEFITQNMWLAYGVGGLLLLLMLAVVLTQLMGGRIRGRRGSRLGISEYYEIDKARRLVLIRRDNTEHLVLIGGHQDLVIESGIGTSAAVEVASPRPTVTPTAQSARPAVFAPRRPTLRPVREEPEM